MSVSWACVLPVGVGNSSVSVSAILEEADRTGFIHRVMADEDCGMVE